MQNESAEARDKISTPFAHAHATIPQNAAHKPNPLPWIIAGAVLLIVGVIGGTLLMQYLGDSTRTLELFPVAKYFEGPRTLVGSRFKADLRVEADLGFKDGLGRLMLFSVADDSRPFAVLIPAAIAKDIFFTKGQNYLSELEVKEGGLIYANTCHKD